MRKLTHRYLTFPPGNWRFLHPHETTLQAFNDGELSRDRSRKIASHLDTCKDCRLIATHLKDDLLKFTELGKVIFPDLDPTMGEGLVRLKKSLQYWSEAHSGLSLYDLSHETMKPELEARVMSELEAYLGVNTVAVLADRSGRGQQRFISEAEDLISAFLGRRVADEVRRKILQILSLENAFPHGPLSTQYPF